MQVIHTPAITQTVQECQGHEEIKKHWKKKNAKKAAAEEEKKLSEDPTIKEYKVEIKSAGRYRVVSTYTHYDNAPNCTKTQPVERILQEEKWEEIDQWNQDPEKLKLANSTKCTYISKECTDQEPKVINNKKVERKCWNEIATYMCRYDQLKECQALRSKHCEYLTKTCLQTHNNQCALFELTFQCPVKKTRKTKKLEDNDIYQGNFETDYPPNDTFSEAVTKISIFQELQKDLQENNTLNATQIRFFTGKNLKCSKSVASDLLYDCCFSYKGLAKELNLSKCTQDEIALAEAREKGLCHYIGSYKEKFLDLWDSRTNHVYCCFTSKLARVLQEQAKKQLNIDWGEPKKAKCTGLSSEDIEKLDFSKLDLSEAYEVPPTSEHLQQKIDTLKKKLKDKLSEEL